MKSNRTIIRTSIFLLLIFLVSLSASTTYGYWVGGFLPSGNNSSNLISIGSWIDEPWKEDYNLNIWENEDDLNHYIPQGVIFSYDGLLYIVRQGENYNPHYHGLPGKPSAVWAVISLDLDWIANTNYRVNSVVVRNGKWYIANYEYNTSDWFVNDPSLKSGGQWSEWREIEPLAISYFGYLQGTNLLDYRANPSDVTYK